MEPDPGLQLAKLQEPDSGYEVGGSFRRGSSSSPQEGRLRENGDRKGLPRSHGAHRLVVLTDTGGNPDLPTLDHVQAVARLEAPLLTKR